jgi:hypothetical protein
LRLFYEQDVLRMMCTSCTHIQKTLWCGRMRFYITK